MAEQQSQPSGPDLTEGVSISRVASGAMLLGHVDGDAVLLARQGDEFFAVAGQLEKCAEAGLHQFGRCFNEVMQ